MPLPTGPTGSALTDYAINTTSFPEDITTLVPLAVMANLNGSSNTIIIGEKSMDPGDYSNNSASNWDEGIYSGAYGGTSRWLDYHAKRWPRRQPNNNWFGSPYDNGVPFLFCDGHSANIGYNASNTANLGNAMNWKNTTPLLPF